MRMKSACFAILNYNGVAHLEHLLPTVTQPEAGGAQRCPIVVLDNCSTQGDRAWLAEHYPQVEVATPPHNDYLFSYNWLLARRTEDVVVLLNNDLRLRLGFLPPLLRHFSESDVFAVGATSRNWEDTQFTCGPARLMSHHGVYHWDYERERQERCHTLFASGGFMAVDRLKFLELGGFNRLFWPGYAEDLDLCFRAWRKGWRCVFEPASVVLHRENGTWGKGDDDCVSRLCLRTGLLFQWATLPPAAPWLERSGFICLTAMRRLLDGQSWWLRVWIAAWFEWRKRRRQFVAMKTSSEELAAILAQIAKAVPSPKE